jgi:hypothetical protein
MPFTVGYGPKGPKIRSVGQPTAAALKLVRDFRASNEQIRFIKRPDGVEINVGQLVLLAEIEGPKRNALRPQE